MLNKDLVLEGVRPSDVAALRQVRAGDLSVDPERMRRLEAKGWIDTPGGVPLITLTGGTLLQK
jgi:hypothetical protein